MREDVQKEAKKRGMTNVVRQFEPYTFEIEYSCLTTKFTEAQEMRCRVKSKWEESTRTPLRQPPVRRE